MYNKHTCNTNVLNPMFCVLLIRIYLIDTGKVLT